jgi:hypothetical protein
MWKVDGGYFKKMTNGRTRLGHGRECFFKKRRRRVCHRKNGKNVKNGKNEVWGRVQRNGALDAAPLQEDDRRAAPGRRY